MGPPGMHRSRPAYLPFMPPSHHLRPQALAVAIIAGMLACRAEAKPKPNAKPAASASGASKPAPRDDAAALRAIDTQRLAFRDALARAKDDVARTEVRRQAARYLERAMIDVVLPRWDGTEWAFNGTSRTPRSGSIACGYFVSTTL